MYNRYFASPAVLLACVIACRQPSSVIAQEKPAEAKPGQLYADQPNEKFAKADPALPNTIRRARADDTIYKLSNPREGKVKGNKGGMQDALLIDWEVVRRGKFDGGEIVVHSSEGQRQNVGLNLAGRDHGTIQLVVGGKFFKKPATGSLPKNVEFYMTRSDSRFGSKAPTFMVSNSMVLGEMRVRTQPRDWTAQEIAAYQKGPGAHTQPNLHPDVGEDSPFVGPKGGVMKRYVDPKGVLLGLEYRLGQWAGENCLGGLVPIYDRDQENELPQSKRAVAKKGYAVAGAEVHLGKNLDGIKLIYAKVKADGSLDTKDTYSSDLLGYKGPKAQVLANDGRKVLGIYFRQGAVVDAFALVLEKKE